MPIEITGLTELQQRFRDYPRKYVAAVQKAMEAALLVVWENVPPYPPQHPWTKYTRTGTLGRSLGVGQGGGMEGKPDIYEVKMGGEYIEGEFGTRLDYAPHVIGDISTEQTVANRHWWTLPQDVTEAARGKVVQVFEIAAEKMAAWLAGRGG